MSSLLPLKCPVVLDSNFMGDPHSTYRRASKFYPEQPVEVILADPVAYLPAGLRAWMITDYDQISAALQDLRFKKDIKAASELFKKSGGRLREIASWDVPAEAVFSNPSVADLGVILDSASRSTVI